MEMAKLILTSFLTEIGCTWRRSNVISRRYFLTLPFFFAKLCGIDAIEGAETFENGDDASNR